MDKMESGVRNKTPNRCCFDYALSKLIVDNGLEDLRKKEDPDSSEFTRYNRNSCTKSRIGRVYTDVKTEINTKIIHIMVSFTDHYNATFIYKFPSNTKIGKDSWYFNNSLLCKLNSPLLQRLFFFY